MTAPLLTATIVLTSAMFAALAARAADRDVLLRRIHSDSRNRRGAEGVDRGVRSMIRRPGVRAPVVGAAAMLVAGPVIAVVAIVVAVVIPLWRRRRRSRRDIDALEDQLGTAVSGIGAALRAGLSLSQALRYAAAECRPPVSDELRAVCDREDLGLPIDRSLGRWASSATSSEVRLVANALRLRIGSGLPSVLTEIGGALRQRRALAREVRSLTAQARLSGSILAVLPIGFFAFLSLTSRHDIATALSTPAGIAAMAGGLVLQGGGYLWIRRLIRVDP